MVSNIVFMSGVKTLTEGGGVYDCSPLPGIAYSHLFTKITFI